MSLFDSIGLLTRASSTLSNDAFFSTNGFEECLVKTVNRGDDADTTGAIAGAIAGARYGLEAIPPRWIRSLDPDLREELAALASQLVGRSPLFTSRKTL